MAAKTVSIPNISCGHCVKTIEREVGELAGVESVTADAVQRTATIRWDEKQTDWGSVEALLVEINYPPAS